MGSGVTPAFVRDFSSSPPISQRTVSSLRSLNRHLRINESPLYYVNRGLLDCLLCTYDALTLHAMLCFRPHGIPCRMYYKLMTICKMFNYVPNHTCELSNYVPIVSGNRLPDPLAGYVFHCVIVCPTVQIYHESLSLVSCVLSRCVSFCSFIINVPYLKTDCLFLPTGYYRAVLLRGAYKSVKITSLARIVCRIQRLHPRGDGRRKLSGQTSSEVGCPHLGRSALCCSIFVFRTSERKMPAAWRVPPLPADSGGPDPRGLRPYTGSSARITSQSTTKFHMQSAVPDCPPKCCPSAALDPAHILPVGEV